MNAGCLVFSQVMDVLDPKQLSRCLDSYPMPRTNLAYANEFRAWRVFAALAQVLIRKARRLYGPDDRDLKIDEMVYALDSLR